MMLQEKVGFAWKILPAWLRLRVIRATQQKFTVSAAAIVTDDSGNVLLLDHVLRPFSGWGLPGGFLTEAEQPEEAIRRELREETGIEITDVQLIRIRTIRRHVEILFAARAIGEPVVNSREIVGLGWFARDSLPDDMSPAQKELVKRVAQVL